MLGIGHTSRVISVAIKEGRPYDERSVFLLTTGGILLYSGLLNIAISRWIKQARSWALAMSSVATGSLIVYLILLLPLPDAGDSTMSALS